MCLIFCIADVFQGTFLMTQAVSKALVSAGAVKGSIITVGSIVGKVTHLEQYQALFIFSLFYYSRHLTFLHHRRLTFSELELHIIT